MRFVPDLSEHPGRSGQSRWIATWLLFALVVAAGMPGPGIGRSSPSPRIIAELSGAVAPEYLVTFTESGLLNGAAWSLTLNGWNYNTRNASISLLEANGTYTYSAYAASARNTTTGTQGAFQNGSLTVAGKPVTVQWSWAGLPPAVPGNETAGAPAAASPSPASFFGLAIGFVVVAVAIALAVAIATKRRGALPPRSSIPSAPSPRPPTGAEPARPGDAREAPDPLSHML